MTLAEGRRYIIEALHATLQNDIYSNGAGYIYGSDNEELSEAELAVRVKAYHSSHASRRSSCARTCLADRQEAVKRVAKLEDELAAFRAVVVCEPGRELQTIRNTVAHCAVLNQFEHNVWSALGWSNDDVDAPRSYADAVAKIAELRQLASPEKNEIDVKSDADKLLYQLWKELRDNADSHAIQRVRTCVEFAHRLGLLSFNAAKLWHAAVEHCPGHEDESGRDWCAYGCDMRERRGDGK